MSFPNPIVKVLSLLLIHLKCATQRGYSSWSFISSDDASPLFLGGGGGKEKYFNVRHRQSSEFSDRYMNSSKELFSY